MTPSTQATIAELTSCSLDDLKKTYFGARNALEFCEDRKIWKTQHHWFLLIDAIAKFRFPDEWPVDEE